MSVELEDRGADPGGAGGGDPGVVPIRRALISVSDKQGLLPLARALWEHGCEIIATGGTARTLTAAGIPVTEISAVTGNPEAFGGRMKTISFAIGAALLHDRERDAEEARRLGVPRIDLVVCNLYPFAQARARGASEEELIEQIDIGGPTMIRAAAKNLRHVAVLTDPGDYPEAVAELARHGGGLSLGTRRRLMRKAFNHTADYDALIAQTMDELAGEPSLRLAWESGRTLRYGENAHQSAVLYRERGAAVSLCDLELLGGKALSYNNMVDIAAALEAVEPLGGSACAVIKHTNPCGLAEGEDQRAVLEAAWAGDPVSAFGSVIAFNRPVALSTVTFLALDGDRRARKFVEVIAAPGFDPEAAAYLRQARNLRIVVHGPGAGRPGRSLRSLPGALLVQDPDGALFEELRWVTRRRPESPDLELIRFGVHAAKLVKSNAIVVVRRRRDGALQLLGMGAGQPNRVEATRLALGRARENLIAEAEAERAAPEAHVAAELARAVLVSDAFFPFEDNVEACAAAGLQVLVSPGGSIRDRRVIRACDTLGLAMAFTGMRHFRH
jgi:phosphoribosylaminoimidazolecarboxamide formyltransferase/IMP cyclohydrolase